MKTKKDKKINKHGKTIYAYEYGHLFNVLFHTGVIINLLLVTWLLLEFY
tara:strand:+ start:1177 stop:1323 length:147 start_codon:yes stop_codon:yes gene_type:complete